MSKETTTAVLGVFVAALPFLGFPESWRVVLYVLSGLGILLFGLLLRTDRLHREALDPMAPNARPAQKVARDITVSASSEAPTSIQ